MFKTIIRKTASACIILFFLSFIFGLCILSVYGLKNNYISFSYYENRNLAAVPEIEKKTVLDGSYFSQIEEWSKDHVAKREGALVYDTLLNLKIIKRPVVNKTVITDNLLLPYNPLETVNDSQISSEAKKIGKILLSHENYCASYGGKFYYVAIPCQYVYYENRYPSFLNSRSEYTKKTAKALFSRLDRLGVSYIDMLADFNQKGHPPEYSSTIDNHYGIFGALETYNVLMNQINTDTGWNLKAMTEEDYSIKTLPNPYMGSRTKKLLGLWESEEKLSLIIPKEDIPFTRYDWGEDIPGASIVYSTPANNDEYVEYGLYMGGDCSITKIETNRPELPDILIYGDSFTNGLESLIWYNFDTMYSVDFRYYDEMTPEEFIKKYQPDIVVCIRDYEQLINPNHNGQ